MTDPQGAILAMVIGLPLSYFIVSSELKALEKRKKRRSKRRM